MNNPKAIKILNDLIADVEHNGIIINTDVKMLKELRPYAIEEKRPLIAKTLRLIAEHIEEYETFAIGIPDDEPIEDHEEELIIENESEPAESLLYLLNLMHKPTNKTNRLDIRSYAEGLQTYADEN